MKKEGKKNLDNSPLGKIVPETHPGIQKKIDKSLNLSIKEAGTSSLMTGFGINYLNPYALALNATSSQIGILYAIMSLVPALVQLKASRLIEKFSRKKTVIYGVLLQTLMLIPIILTSYLFIIGYEYTIWILITFIGLFYAFGALSGPAWFSWMGSLVPEDKRGIYFSKRNKIAGTVTLIATISAALIIEYFRGLQQLTIFGITLEAFIIGFGILFLIAFLGRFTSFFLFTKKYEPRIKIRKKDYFSFFQFLKKAPETPFGRFTIYSFFMRFSISIAAPFFVVYMLRDLQLSYIWYMIITVSGIIFQLVFLSLLGKVSDKYGNIKLLQLCSFTLILTPLLWLVSSNTYYLALVPALTGGFSWAGFLLASNNYIYDSVRQEKRTYGIAYYNLLIGIGLFLGASLGSILVTLNISFMNSILFIFVASAFLRILVYAIGSHRLREVRHVKRFRTQYLIKEFQPARGLVNEVHRLNSFKQKVFHYI